MIYLAADHAGFEQKEEIKKFLDAEGIEYADKGPDHFDDKDDYPDFAYPAVAAMDPDKDKAFLFCGSGQGMAILANKLPGIRAAVVWNPAQAKETREDNDANVMSVPSRFEDIEDVKRSVKVFLDTPFSGEERHDRRLKKIADVEKKLHSHVPEAYNE